MSSPDSKQSSMLYQENPDPEIIAAIDLGSNSFHMVVADNHDGRLKIIDRLREMVRLSAGLDQSQQLNEKAAERALACLERFGQRLRDMHADSVRAIGTNALRRAKKTGKFLAAAESALGHPIQIISGIEEARLIYQGTNYAISRPNDRRIVIDIGGGSTEIIIGEGVRPLHMESLFMGCVSMSETHFPDGKLSRKSFDRAFLKAKLQLRPIVSTYKHLGWDLEIGTSGTIKAISEVVHGQLGGGKIISQDGLHQLRELILQSGHVKELNFASLKKERLPVFPGGLAILLAIFDSLGIDNLNFSDGGLREGVLYDLLGRLHLDQGDTRVESVNALEQRYHVDFTQANRVELSALLLLTKVKKVWNLKDIEFENYLRWAARLHEVGMDIAHSGYHRHGAYLLQNADMPGFAWNEQRILACLVGSHRRKIRTELFEDIHSEMHSSVRYLLVLLRLAVLLNRDRIDLESPVINLDASKEGLKIEFSDRWLEKYPLTQIDLEQESDFLKALEIDLQFS